MKAVTIWQPYASLIAAGAKRFETRSRRTLYRGKIAVHAGKPDMRNKLDGKTRLAVIKTLGTDVTGGGNFALYNSDTPRGAVIAAAELTACYKIEPESRLYPVRPFEPAGARTIDICGDELLFGDFTPGRYAWELQNVKILDKPIYCKGKQGLWDLPPEIERELGEIWADASS